MLVAERMSHPVLTINPDMPIQDALNFMRKEHIQRLPVVDKRGRLVGIITEEDLLHASPSDVSSLSVYELTYLLSKITVDEIMTREVITIEGDTPIEEAARIMADTKIGGLPVMREGQVVGIITETDLFKIFLELLGAREPGVRLSALVPNVPGELAQLTSAIFNAGGNIMALGTALGQSSENRELIVKVAGVTDQELKEAIEPFIEQFVDIRTY
jgi:acetoin utilization protein AcuB